MSTTQAYDCTPRRTATINIAHTLLALSADGSAVGLAVSIYLVGVVLDVVSRLLTSSSGLGGASAAQRPELGASTQVGVSIFLAGVEAVAVVTVSIWACRAVAQARAVACVVLGALPWHRSCSPGPTCSSKA